MDKCDGFGLLQRDRRFGAYEDGEAAYHQRPSLWIEPTSDWGPGRVMLMEIPTTNELSDNTVALWEPAQTPQPGDRIEFSYRQHWTMDHDPSQAGGHVVATRSGVHDWQPEKRTVVVEFTGTALNQSNEIPLTARGPGGRRGRRKNQNPGRHRAADAGRPLARFFPHRTRRGRRQARGRRPRRTPLLPQTRR